MKKTLLFLSLILSCSLIPIACGSDDNSDKNTGSNSFNPEGDWKITLNDDYDNSTETFTFSTDKNGVSHDQYAEIGYTKLTYQNKKLVMTLKDYERHAVPSLEFDAPDPAANRFVTMVKDIDIDDNGATKTYTTEIILERVSKSGKDPNPDPKKSIDGVWEHSNQKYQIKIENGKGIVYNLDQAGSHFPKKLLGDTFYDKITKKSDSTWTADFYQWRFTDDDVENGRWVNEGQVVLELSADGKSFYQGTRTFIRIQ